MKTQNHLTPNVYWLLLIVATFVSCHSKTSYNTPSVTGTTVVNAKDTLFLSFWYGMSEKSANEQIEREIANERLAWSSDKATLTFTFPSGTSSVCKPIFTQDTLRYISLTPYDHSKQGNSSTTYYSITDLEARKIINTYVDKYGKYDSTSVEEEVSINLSGTQKKSVITKFVEWQTSSMRISISLYYGIEGNIEMNIYYLPMNSEPPSKWKLREKAISDSTRKSLTKDRRNSI